MRPRQIALVAFLTSCVVHGVAVLSLKLIPYTRDADAGARLVTFEAPTPMTGTQNVGQHSVELTAPPVVGGAKSQSTLDRSGAEARGGDVAASEAGLLLFAFASDVTLTDAELNNLQKNQSHRLRTSDERASLEQRRATPRPTDSTFLATGKGEHAERRKPSAHDSTDGAPRGGELPRSQPRPGQASTETEAAPALDPVSGSVTAASPRRDRSQRGIVTGAGRRISAKASVATARPNVDLGPAATTAPMSDERVRDDVDAELLAARLERSLVEASMQRAQRTGPGVGGAEGAHVGLGNAARGDGARALPYLPGQGTEGALDTRDARYIRWFTELRARVQRALVFPEQRALGMDQGTSLYRVVVGRDGRIKTAPKLVRSSGFADLDQAAISAILEAAPFAPLPLELLPEQPEVAILMPIQFWNPMVR